MTEKCGNKSENRAENGGKLREILGNAREIWILYVKYIYKKCEKGKVSIQKMEEMTENGLQKSSEKNTENGRKMTQKR
jgi:hypothetical protein